MPIHGGGEGGLTGDEARALLAKYGTNAMPDATIPPWRMALAKDLLRRRDMTVGEVAEHVGYSSASTFSVAFARHVGLPPKHYARTLAGA